LERQDLSIFFEKGSMTARHGQRQQASMQREMFRTIESARLALPALAVPSFATFNLPLFALLRYAVNMAAVLKTQSEV
jgi:hypothetical protein